MTLKFVLLVGPECCFNFETFVFGVAEDTTFVSILLLRFVSGTLAWAIVVDCPQINWSAKNGKIGGLWLSKEVRDGRVVRWGDSCFSTYSYLDVHVSLVSLSLYTFQSIYLLYYTWVKVSLFSMNNAYKFDEYGNMMPSKQSIPSSTRIPQYEPPSWRQQSGPRYPSFPPLNMIGSESSYRSRMAPPMDRHANRSRSPLNMERRPRDYRSRTPPREQRGTSFDAPSRPYISYPRPLYSNRDESPSRPALRGVSPNHARRYQSTTAESRLPYPTLPPQEHISRTISKPSDYGMERTQSAGPISDITKGLLAINPTSTPESDLIPRPLNTRSNPSNNTIRKATPSMCEYLSLDELENLWQSQDLYTGTVTAPATKPCSPLYRMTHIGPMPPSLADHPAFKSEHRQYNSFACA